MEKSFDNPESHRHAPCHACATVCTHSLISRVGQAEVQFASGTRVTSVRCAVAERQFVLMLPASMEEIYDQPSRVIVWDPEFADRSVHIIGWTEPLQDEVRLPTIDAFAAQHPTEELLDLGEAWLLRSFDVAEARLVWDGAIVDLLPQEL